MAITYLCGGKGPAFKLGVARLFFIYEDWYVSIFITLTSKSDVWRFLFPRSDFIE